MSQLIEHFLATNIQLRGFFFKMKLIEIKLKLIFSPGQQRKQDLFKFEKKRFKDQFNSEQQKTVADLYKLKSNKYRLGSNKSYLF